MTELGGDWAPRVGPRCWDQCPCEEKRSQNWLSLQQVKTEGPSVNQKTGPHQTPNHQHPEHRLPASSTLPVCGVLVWQLGRLRQSISFYCTKPVERTGNRREPSKWAGSFHFTTAATFMISLKVRWPCPSFHRSRLSKQETNYKCLTEGSLMLILLGASFTPPPATSVTWFTLEANKAGGGLCPTHSFALTGEMGVDQVDLPGRSWKTICHPKSPFLSRSPLI